MSTRGKKKGAQLRDRIFEVLGRGSWLTSTMLAERLGTTNASITSAIRRLPDNEKALLEERRGLVNDVANTAHVLEFRLRVVPRG